MKKNLLLLVLNCLMINMVSAQNREDLAPCGTLDHKSEWLTNYQANPMAYRQNTGVVLHIPMTLHVLGDNTGSGYFSLTNILTAFCELNEQMAQSEIQFFLAGDIHYINNSDWNSHATVLEGAAMMFENNVPNTVNTYIVSDPAGNCGYNLPYAGIAVAKSCATAGNHTWAHEVGHNLSLPHPFLGWEGGISHDGSVPPSFNDPAPTTVLYDYTYFKDTLIIDTMIIDTAYVEYVDGRNCEVAADGFCDTPPDYLAQRWQCNGDAISPQTQKDPDGVVFQSDGTLIMNYADDDCQARFSPEQIAAMRANLLDEKPELVSSETPLPQITETTVPQIPAEDEIVQFDNIDFEWTAVAGAEQYILQVSRLSSFSIKDQYVVSGNSHTVNDLLVDKTYYWRVKPYNHYSFCAEFSERIKFETGMISDIESLESISSLSIQPNLTTVGKGVNLQINTVENINLNVNIYDVSGKLMHAQTFKTSTGNQHFSLATEDLARGVYWVNMLVENRKVVRKLVIQ